MTYEDDGIVNRVVVYGPAHAERVARARRVRWYSWRSVPALHEWLADRATGWPSPARVVAWLIATYVALVWACWLLTLWACAMVVLAPYWLWILAGSLMGRGIRRNVRLGVGDAIREREA